MRIKNIERFIPKRQIDALGERQKNKDEGKTMINIRKLEAELWESADLLRAGSKLTSNQGCHFNFANLFKLVLEEHAL